MQNVEIKSHVDRRLELWKYKDMEDLLNQTKTIQKELPQRQKPQKTEKKSKIFAALVLEENVNVVTWLLDDDTSSGVLSFSADVVKSLRQKHPNAKSSNDTVTLHGAFSNVNKIIFDGVCKT